MIVSLYPWLALRLNIIYRIFLDIILFCILFFSPLIKIQYFYLNIYNSLFLFIWILSSYVIGRYHNTSTSMIDAVKEVFISTVNIIVFYILSLVFYLKLYNISDFSLINVQIFFFCKYAISSLIIQYFFKRFFIKKFKPFKIWYVLGNNDFYRELDDFTSKNNIKLNFIETDVLQNLDFLIKKNIIIGNLNDHSYEIQKKIMNLNFKGSNVLSIINWCEIALQRIPLIYLKSGEILNYFSKINRDLSLQVRLKRIGDIFLSIFLILLTLPIVIFFGLIIYLEDSGPILYSQNRVGKNGLTFRIFKLRTMHVNAEKKGAQWSKKGDNRVTKVGKFLRSSRVDELPQLFSVLLGDMSLIGPRPERPEIDELLKEKIPYYELKYLVKPGLSGWAQVNYPYGSSIYDSEMKLTYDFFYIRNFSFWLDIVIFFKTIRLVFKREGSIPNT